MPHKRNPERSEHLDTLARLARAQAGVMLEAMVQIHERDGRGWKAEWPVFPELCLLTSSALALAIDLVRGSRSALSGCGPTWTATRGCS
jgi:adenylosuccinate lyase